MVNPFLCRLVEKIYGGVRCQVSGLNRQIASWETQLWSGNMWIEEKTVESQYWWFRKKSEFLLTRHSDGGRNPVISITSGLRPLPEWRDWDFLRGCQYCKSKMWWKPIINDSAGQSLSFVLLIFIPDTWNLTPETSSGYKNWIKFETHAMDNFHQFERSLRGGP